MNYHQMTDDQIRADAELMLRIVQRFERVMIAANLPTDRDTTLNQLANFQYSSQGPLDLRRMAHWPRDQDIVHDVAGILTHFDKRTGMMREVWSPRFSAR
jgi:hypothetical protein